MEEALQWFDAYNIGINYSFKQFSMYLGDHMVHVTTTKGERPIMMGKINTLKIYKRSLKYQLLILGEGRGVMGSTRHMKYLKPTSYGSAWEVNELYNFLYHMQLY